MKVFAGTAGAEDQGGRLASLNGAEFDRAYMDQMVRDHQAKTVRDRLAASK